MLKLRDFLDALESMLNASNKEISVSILVFRIIWMLMVLLLLARELWMKER